MKNGLKCQRINWVNKWIILLKLSLFSFRSLNENWLKSSRKRSKASLNVKESTKLNRRTKSTCIENADKNKSILLEEKKQSQLTNEHGIFSKTNGMKVMIHPKTLYWNSFLHLWIELTILLKKSLLEFLPIKTILKWRVETGYCFERKMTSLWRVLSVLTHSNNGNL
mgnify:CR=1 FL=1